MAIKDTFYMIAYKRRTIIRFDPTDKRTNICSVFIRNGKTYDPIRPIDKVYLYKNSCPFCLDINEYCKNFNEATQGRRQGKGRKKCLTQTATPTKFAVHGQIQALDFGYPKNYKTEEEAEEALLSWMELPRWPGNCQGLNSSDQFIIKNAYDCFEEQPYIKVKKTLRYSSSKYKCLICGENCFFFKKIDLLNHYFSKEREFGKLFIFKNEQEFVDYGNKENDKKKELGLLKFVAQKPDHKLSINYNKINRLNINNDPDARKRKFIPIRKSPNSDDEELDEYDEEENNYEDSGDENISKNSNKKRKQIESSDEDNDDREKQQPKPKKQKKIKKQIVSNDDDDNDDREDNLDSDSADSVDSADSSSNKLVDEPVDKPVAKPVNNSLIDQFDNSLDNNNLNTINSDNLNTINNNLFKSITNNLLNDQIHNPVDDNQNKDVQINENSNNDKSNDNSDNVKSNDDSDNDDSSLDNGDSVSNGNSHLNSPSNLDSLIGYNKELFSTYELSKIEENEEIELTLSTSNIKVTNNNEQVYQIAFNNSSLNDQDSYNWFIC